MSREKLSRAAFQQVFELQITQEWLQEQETHEALLDLISLCGDLEEQQLVCELLSRFEYVDSKALSAYLRELVNTILDHWKLDESSTQIVATTMDSEGDSSQSLIHALKPEFKRAGWDNARTVNMMGRSVSYLKSHPNVVLVDEFVGTGQTMISRVCWLKKELHRAVEEGRTNKQNPTIRICVIAAMEWGLRAIENLGVDIRASVVLKKGISGYYTGIELREACKQMLRLERKLAKNINGIPLPSFGYGFSQSLFSTVGNTPNNVFPVFWWSHDAKKERRSTLLQRLELPKT